MKPDTTTGELERYGTFLRNVARGMADPDEADDLVQETMLRGLETRPRDDGKLRAWLRAVCRNVFLQRRRSEARRQRREEVRARPEAASSSSIETVEHRHAVRAVARAVTELEEPYYTTVRLRYFDGLPPGDIARHLDIPLSTVKRRLERALARLRGRLDESRGSWQAVVAPLAGLPWSKTAAATSSAPLAAGPELLVGGAVMTKKVVFVVTVVLVATGLFWWAQDGETDSSLETQGVPVADEEGLPVGPRRTDETAQPDVEPSRPQGTPKRVNLGEADRDLDIFGRVLTEHLTPVGGAHVQTVRFPWRRVSVLNSEGWNEVERVASTRSDDLGQFVMRHARGEIVQLRVSADGYATKHVAQCVAGERVDVVLEPAAPFTVIAVGEDGEPVPGVRVRFWKRDRSRPSAPSYDNRRGVTDGGGIWAVSDVTPGRGRVALEHETLGDPGWQDVTIVAGRPNEFRFVMPAGRTVRGRVVDAATRQPVAGARIGVNWTQDRSVTSDADGWFALPGWTGNGVTSITATAEGYGRERRDVPEEGEVVFELTRGDVATGRIVDEDGGAVSGALVTAVASRWSSGLQSTDSVSTRSGADGTFLLRDLHHGMPHTLVVQARGYGRMLLDFDPARKEDDHRIDFGDIALARGLAIEGRVVNGEGEPITNATVSLTGFNRDRHRLRESSLAGFHYAKTETRRTDDLGRFRFPDLSSGEYGLEVKRTGAATVERGISLRDEDRLEVEVVVMETPRLEIVVEDDAGVPLGELSMRLRRRDTPGIEGRTDASGRAEFEGLEAGTAFRVELHLSRRPYLMPKDLEFTHDGRPVRIVVERAAMISGVVLDPDGDPAPRILVQHAAPGEEKSGVFTDAKGRFRFGRRMGDRVTITVDGSELVHGRSPGGQLLWRGKLEAVVAPSEDLVLKLTKIETDGSIAIRVLDPDGKAVPHARVWVSARALNRQLETDGSGRVSMEGLPDLDVSVIALADDDDPWVASLRQRVKPNGQVVTLRFRPGAVIRGIVVEEDGSPVPGARVEAITKEFDGMAVLAGENGRFEIRIARGQAYTVTAEWRSRTTGKRRRVVLEDVEPGDVTLRAKSH